MAVYPSSNRGGVVCNGSSFLLYTDPDTDWCKAVYGRSACDSALMKQHERKVFNMSEYNDYHCPECDGTGGNHYPGCTYEGTGKENYHSSRSGGGMSTFGAVLCTIASFIGGALFFVILGIDVEKVPVFFIVLVIAVIAGILGAIGSSRGW